MKHFLKLTLLCLFISTITYSQSIEKLDEKNGFKTLKLNVSFDEVNKIHIIPSLKAINQQGLGDIYVCMLENNYKNKDLFNVFDVKIDEVMLMFDHNKKLFSIHLNKNYPKSNDLSLFEQAINTNTDLFGRLARLYGTKTQKDDGDNDNKTFVSVSWVANKTILDLSTTYYKNEKDTVLAIVITSKEYAEKLELNGF